MKVILVNGSPHPHGTTFTALSEVEKTLVEAGLETEIFQLGTEPIGGCMGDGSCKRTGKCFRDDGRVNEFLPLAAAADGFVFGSPVHYAAASGSITSFLDRAFYCTAMSGQTGVFQHKPGAAIVVARRGGAAAAFDQLNKYFTISQMPIVSSTYWNMVYGTRPEQAAADAEGMATMRTLGRNMAWLLKSIAAGRTAGLLSPGPDPIFAELKRQASA